MAYCIPEFLEEYRQLMERPNVLNDPTQAVYRKRIDQLTRYIIEGDRIRLRNKALGIAPEDDHYVSVFAEPEDSLDSSVAESDPR